MSNRAPFSVASDQSARSRIGNWPDPMGRATGNWPDPMGRATGNWPDPMRARIGSWPNHTAQSSLTSGS